MIVAAANGEQQQGQQQEQQQQQQQQIIVSKNNIQNVQSYGAYNDPNYTEQYNPYNLLDNKINTWSFWSQNGNSGFSFFFNETLNKPLCDIELNVFNPQKNGNGKTPFNFTANGNLILKNEVIDGEIVHKKVGNPQQNNTCIKDVNQISMDFRPPQKQPQYLWTTLAELKLFTDQQRVDTEDRQNNVTKIVITNSTAEVEILNSNVSINVDETSKVSNMPVQKIIVEKPVAVPTTDKVTEEMEQEDEERDIEEHQQEEQDDKEQQEEDDE